MVASRTTSNTEYGTSAHSDGLLADKSVPINRDVINCTVCDYLSALKSIYQRIETNLINGLINHRHFNNLP